MKFFMYLWVAFCLCSSAFGEELIYRVKNGLTIGQSRKLASVMDRFEKPQQLRRKSSLKTKRMRRRFKKPSRFAKRITLRKEMVKTEMQKLKASGLFEYVEENTIEHEIAFSVEDPDADRQWHHPNIDTLGAWEFTQGSQEVVVAVCDSGVDANHEDLRGNVLLGYNFVNDNTDSSPSTNHGTQVAGIIAARLNQFGGHGIAPNVKILPLRITNDGNTFLSTIVECIEYAADNGAKVINVSFTGVNSNAVQAAGEYAKSKGALLVYAAGNQGRRRSNWQDRNDVLAVGSTTDRERKSSFSNYGPFIDLVAPGSNIFTTSPNNRYSSISGTSFSAPIVSGAAALIYSLNPSATANEVENFLEAGARRIGDDFTFGAGLLNVNESVRLAYDAWGSSAPTNPSPNDPPPSDPGREPAEEPTVPAISMSVEDIDLTVFYSRRRARTEAEILILDENRNPVVGAEVMVDIDGENVSAKTNSQGIAFFETPQKSRNHRFFYEVKDVSAPGYDYNEDLNERTKANIRARRRFWFF